MKALGPALLAAQRAAPELQRDSTNPGFKGSKYISLDSLVATVLPVLNEHGIVLVQSPTVSQDGRPALRTKLLHAESGEFEEDTMLLELEKSTPQAQGSAITYARRYSLMSMLGLVADADDDGNATSMGRQQSKVQERNRATEADRTKNQPIEPTEYTLEAKLLELAAEYGMDLAPLREKIKTQQQRPGFRDWLVRQVAAAESSLALRAEQERADREAAVEGEGSGFVAPKGRRGEKAAA